MRKEVPRDSAANKTARAASPGKGQKRAAPSVKTEVKKKKPVKSAEGEATKSGQPAEKKKKLLKPKVVLTKLSPTSVPQLAKAKQVKEGKKETGPKQVKPKPKKVVVSKATKKEVKLENESKRAKIVRAVKDVKKAKSVVASKMAKISPKKITDSGTVKKISGKINVVKQHNIVKRVNKMSGKKPCVVSVKISNAHSTVTLSVKQNKQVNKKDSLKCSKSGGGKNNDRSTISIVKKGIASRRKSTSKECTSQESSPSQSPTRDTSPIRSKDEKTLLKMKKSENVKSTKKMTKQSSVESNKGVDDKSKIKHCESKMKDNNRDSSDNKTEVIINDTFKIKTENVGEDQNMEIEFTTSADKHKSDEKHSKKSEENIGIDVETKSKTELLLQDSKVKSPLNEYSNLKSVDSSTSDEIPLELLKSKQKHIKQEKDNDDTSQSSVKKTKEGKESPRQDAVDNIPLSMRDDESSNSNTSSDKKKNETDKQSKSKSTKKISKASLKKIDQESVAKLKITSKKEKLKALALKKQKVAKLVKNSKLSEEKHRKDIDCNDKAKEETKGRRRVKLLKFWNGPKRHRVASLNAIAKVHCLYENESRGALNEVISNAAMLQRAIQESKKLARQLEMKEKEKEKGKDKEKEKKVTAKKPTPRKKSPEPASTRSLRTNPGVRSVGRNFDILNVISSTSLSSSSSEESSDSGEEKKQLVLQPSVKQKQLQIKKEESEHTTDDESPKKTPPSQNEDSKDGVKKIKKRRRKRNELTMDLKDMVVRKRMASLNASAIMTASYSTEKKSREEKRKEKIEEEIKKERKKKKKIKEQPESPLEAEESSADEDVIVRTTNNKQKVAVIVNQDTDVTITGVYVNSTTRSTHHEGYCSIAGMQYRISSTSHTQTEATAVATETVLHAEHPACLPEGGTAQTVVTTALAATPCKSYTPLSALSSMQPPGHHHPPCQGPRGPPLSPLQRRHGCSSAFSAPPNYPPPPGPPHPQGPPPHPDVHGYYQPAGPLISTHHHHHHSTTSVTKLPPPPTPPPSSAPHPPSETSDTEVVPADSHPPPPGYRYPAGQPYNYGYQYYPSPPASSLQYPAHNYHQDICYPPSGYPPGYFPKGHYPHAPGYRRYGHQYYPPQDFYPNPPPSSNPPSSNSQMIVAPPSGGQSSSNFPPSDGNYPPPLDPYPPPPQSYYPGYSAGPPPPCYSTHSPSSRGLFIDAAAYQSCPCPMQSCPKNVHTGPLTGVSKGSMKNQTTPLPPVALALPLEPPGALGPPSPARGSAGMPPPPSPALATARNPPQSPPAKLPPEQTGLLTISKMVTDAVLLADQDAGLPLADFIPKSEPIKLEVEDIVKIEATEEVKCNRKRRKSLKGDVKRQAVDVMTELDIKVQPDDLEFQERLVVKEEPEKDTTEKLVEKQLPLSDNGATVKTDIPVLNGIVKTKKRKSVSSDSEPAAKITKCVKSVLKKNAKNKKAEENIAPVETVEETAKVCRQSKPVERRKSSCSPHKTATAASTGPRDIPTEESPNTETEGCKKRKVVRGKKTQEKTKADHLLRSHGKSEGPATIKERRLSKSGSSPVRGAKKAAAPIPPPLDPSADSTISLPGLRKSLAPKWSNGWSWEGTPYMAKVFTKIDDGAVLRKCYPAMRHAQGDVIHPRDCILLKSGPRKLDLPYVAKVAAMWEDPEDGEMMVSLLWYYRPEHTEQGRRSDDIPDEIFASRHKDTNSVACIEDKCFVLTFNEYCRYRRSIRTQDEGRGCSGARLVPLPEGSYPRQHRQPPGRVAPDLVFFCRRVYDFRQKRILKNPC
ncbi:uncharacterized protein LOC128987739 isoform X2 [Macrosteles quadrilineatus]|uniref:uncharacterized protein LOC128987739 isoform X2 n=1 Tax=Macrosteles quadrilineatus TaxID=74068 RepID=UPI0023E0E06A|nr:uncharacterized protein LOC128987739 isoform X2 [Macrosteles quadrilineatus]